MSPAMKIPRRVRNRTAAVAGLLYLGGAVVYRVAAQLETPIPALAPLYTTLPGGLAGAVLYAAWTGLRARRQSPWSLALSAAVGVIIVWLIGRTRLAAGPGSAAAAWEMICDLSAVTILFALFMSATLPFARRQPAP